MTRRVIPPDRWSTIAEGAALLGAGGGGTLAVARRLIDTIDRITDGIGVEVVGAPFDELAADGRVAVAADVGASDTWVEHQDLATLHAFEQLQATLPDGDGFVAVAPGEVGPESTLAAAAVAAHLGIPVLDADGAGRALPTLPLSLYDVGGISASPCAIAGTGTASALLRADDADGIEALMRPLLGLAAFDDSAGMALWSMTVGDVARLGVIGTLSLAESIGAALAAARRDPAAGSPVDAVLALVDGRGAVLASGGFRADSADAAGFTSDVVRITQRDGSTIVVVGSNENLVVWDLDQPEPIATAPDLACWIDHSGHATTTSDLIASNTPDAHVTLLGLSSDDRLWRGDALARFRTVLEGEGYWGPPVRTPVATPHSRASAMSRPTGG